MVGWKFGREFRTAYGCVGLIEDRGTEIGNVVAGSEERGARSEEERDDLVGRRKGGEGAHEHLPDLLGLAFLLSKLML